MNGMDEKEGARAKSDVFESSLKYHPTRLRDAKNKQERRRLVVTGNKQSLSDN